MSNTITAIYRTIDVADLVRGKIAGLGVSDRHITVLGGPDTADDVDTLHLPEDESSTYRQALRDGHYLVSADVEDAHVDQTAEIMRHPETMDAGVDIDAYEAGYKATPDYAATSAGTEGETSIPIAEERLVVGKRSTTNGSAHVRTYTQEVPVEERVRLREERLTVDRRPIERTLTGDEANALFEDRDIEVTTTSEEAVVDKETVVTEEIVVGKEVTEREQVIEDTVRHTEVDIDKDRT